MKKACSVALSTPGYLLSEESHSKLQKIRNHWLLMAEMSYASTLDEERVVLQIPRSVLAECFEQAAEQLSEVLAATQSYRDASGDAARKH
jgi:hypothetical protein